MSNTEASSFRDSSNRVYVDDERFIRGFTEAGYEPFAAAHAAGVLQSLVEKGWLLAYQVVEPAEVPDVVPSSSVIQPDRLRFVSQPSEWSFSMLKDAALLTLDINLELIDSGFILKDATAFNVTFDGATPVFMDHGSVARLGETGIWDAYGQFVDHFLSPLMLEAYAGVAFQSRLRAAVDGIPVTEMNSVLRGSSRRRKGVTSHVVLRSRIEGRSASYDTQSREGVAGLELPRSAIRKSIAKIRRLVAGLSSDLLGTWSNYADSVPYDEAEYEAKLAFVRSSSEEVGGGTLVDVGANSGDFALAVADAYDTVIALDIDPGAIDRLYSGLLKSRDRRVLPLVMDLLSPTPAIGWGNTERPSFLHRIDGDLGLWLAVLHHITIHGPNG